MLVESEEQARALRFVSSPTIRVDGDDVALELRESSCGSEACTDGCGDQIACRVWVHRGREYTEPPVQMMVDAILGHVYGGAPARAASEPGAYELPENLARFFAGKAASAAFRDRACCPPAEQRFCCDADAKEGCCDAATRRAAGVGKPASVRRNRWAPRRSGRTSTRGYWASLPGASGTATAPRTFCRTSCCASTATPASSSARRRLARGCTRSPKRDRRPLPQGVGSSRAAVRHPPRPPRAAGARGRPGGASQRARRLPGPTDRTAAPAPQGGPRAHRA